MRSDMEPVSFVLMIFTACGRKESVVHVAATRPSKVVKLISF